MKTVRLPSLKCAAARAASQICPSSHSPSPSTGRIQAGTVSDHFGYFGDFFATAAELAGVQPPPGLDSIIECAAASVMLWHLVVTAHGATDEAIEESEHRGHRFIGFTFFALSAYDSAGNESALSAEVSRSIL